MESATLWMGGLSPEMNEAFIIEAFANVGYEAIGVKEIKNKSSNEKANYCFVDFGDVNVAREVLIKVNNQPIPGTQNAKFKLNRSEYGRSSGGSIEYSLFVGDLSPEVTDDMLLDFFRKKYPSARAAKVVYDDRGLPRGYGFVRFFNEKEHESSLTEMQGATGLGQRPIRVNKALKNKNQGSTPPLQTGGEQGAINPSMLPNFLQLQMQYMQQMQAYMEQCHQYAQQAAMSAGWMPNTPNTLSTQQGMSSSQSSNDGSVLNFIQNQHDQLVSQTAQISEDEELVDPNPPVDIVAMNQKIIDLDDKLFFELELSRWDPELAVVSAREQRPIKPRFDAAK